MSSDIEMIALEELCEKVIDCPHSTPVWMNEGVVVLRSSNIKNGRLDLTNPSYTNECNYEERSKRAIVQAGDLVITREAPMGEVCLIPENLKCCLGQRMVMLRPDHARCNEKYLLYALQSSGVQNEIRSHEGTGSTVSNLRIPVLKALLIPTPDLCSQKAIAHILGTLDSKIELNRKTNEILEAIAKALFKSWFVDFDPVRAKAEGRPTGFPAEISDLFPYSFEDSELGEIPSGWEIAEIDHIVNLRKDSIDPLVFPEEVFDHYSIPAFDAGKNPAEELGFSIKSKKFLVGDDDLLISKLNPSTPRVWIPFTSSARRSICSTEFLVCQATTNVGRAFAYCVARSDSIIESMTGLAGGTSNSHQRIRPGDFLSLVCCMGSPKIRSAFSDAVEPLLLKTLALRTESRSLASIRDTLLPKLISGEIRIPDAEKMLEEVGV